MSPTWGTIGNPNFRASKLTARNSEMPASWVQSAWTKCSDPARIIFLKSMRLVTCSQRAFWHLALKERDGIFTGQNIFEIAEVQKFNQLPGSKIQEQAPKGDIAQLGPQIKAGIGDRRKRQVDHSLVRPEPTKLWVICE